MSHHEESAARPAARFLFLALSLWLVFLVLDIARSLVWPVASPFSSLYQIALKVIFYLPWLAYALIMGSLVFREPRSDASIPARLGLEPALFHGLAGMGLVLIHTLWVSLALVTMKFPGAELSALGLLAKDVALNFLPDNALVSLAVFGLLYLSIRPDLARLKSHQASETGAQKALRLQHRGSLRVVPARDIEWIGAAGNYVEVYAGGAPIRTRGSISRMAEQLDDRQFVRTHRSVMVNLSKARQLENGPGGWRLVLESGARLPVSRRKLEALRTAMA